MQSLADRKQEFDTLVDGFLVPIFRREDPTTGRMLNGLGREDFQRVCAGYACPDCLAKFKTYMVTCPVCGFTRDIGRDIERAPDYWLQHLEDRTDPDHGIPIPRQALIEQALRDIHADPDVDHVPLSKLKRKHRPRTKEK